MQTILFNILLFLIAVWVFIGILFLWQQFRMACRRLEKACEKKEERKQSVSPVTQGQIEQARQMLIGKSKSYGERYAEISKEITTNSQNIPDVPDTSSKEKPVDNPDTFAGKNSSVPEETEDAEGTEEDNEIQVDYTMDEPDEDCIVREELQIADAALPEVSPSAILAREVVRVTGWHKNDNTLDGENEAEVQVEIPGGFREMLNAGKAAFDKSTKNLGGFTPNIRIKGESGIKGQATIVQKADTQAITQSMSNLAMMAMVQSVLEKLDVIEEKVEEIKMGQKDDRIGCVIGHFKGFMDLYPTFKSSEELNMAATIAYMNMQSGLSQLHLQIDNNRKKLNGAPSNDWQTLWNSITHPRSNEAEHYQKCYQDYVYDIQLYNRLILLSDVVLYLKGDNDIIKKNHKIMDDYCNLYIDESFVDKMKYLMADNIEDITNILDYNRNLSLALDGILAKDMKIECKQSDVKLLHVKKDEENEPEEC